MTVTTTLTDDDFTLFACEGHVKIKCDFCRERRTLGAVAFVRAAEQFITEHKAEGCKWKD